MIIQVKDDFDLEKIINSGQCFRPVENNGVYRFITGENVLYISPCEHLAYDDHYASKKTSTYEISCSEEEWNNIWIPYFDLKRNYSKIRNLAKDDNFLKSACNFGKGIRVLKQDRWEMLISYIISQRKSIPAIRTSIERICECCGTKVSTGQSMTQCVNTNYIEEDLYLFPTPYQLMNAKGLENCGLGYRLPYIREAARMVFEKEIDLDAATDLPDDELFEILCSIKGVGTKVANCVMLFGYSRTGRAPVDVWIQRIIDNEFDGENRFPEYGDVAGIMQQYAFYYMISQK